MAQYPIGRPAAVARAGATVSATVLAPALAAATTASLWKSSGPVSCLPGAAQQKSGKSGKTSADGLGNVCVADVTCGAQTGFVASARRRMHKGCSPRSAWGLQVSISDDRLEKPRAWMSSRGPIKRSAPGQKFQTAQEARA